MDRKFASIALLYAVAGMLLGLTMAATESHVQMVTHAHILLVGFVVPFIYAICHKLWLAASNARLANAQFYIHQLGAFIMSVALFLLYSGSLPAPTLAPVLALASVLVVLGALLMAFMFYTTSEKS